MTFDIARPVLLTHCPNSRAGYLVIFLRAAPFVFQGPCRYFPLYRILFYAFLLTRNAKRRCGRKCTLVQCRRINNFSDIFCAEYKTCSRRVYDYGSVYVNEATLCLVRIKYFRLSGILFIVVSSYVSNYLTRKFCSSIYSDETKDVIRMYSTARRQINFIGGCKLYFSGVCTSEPQLKD